MQQDTLSRYLPLPLFYLLPSAYFLIHATEEVPAFGPWATKHFTPLSTGLFATAHIPFLLLVFLASYQAAHKQKHGGWVIFSIATQIQFGLNALFHLTTAALFLEYSPGMMTGGSMGLLLTWYMLRRVWREKLLSGRELVLAGVEGVILAVAAVSILFLH